MSYCHLGPLEPLLHHHGAQQSHRNPTSPDVPAELTFFITQRHSPVSPSQLDIKQHFIHALSPHYHFYLTSPLFTVSFHRFQVFGSLSDVVCTLLSSPPYIRSGKPIFLLHPLLYPICLPNHRLIWRMAPAGLFSLIIASFCGQSLSGQTAKLQRQSYHPWQGRVGFFLSS